MQVQFPNKMLKKILIIKRSGSDYLTIIFQGPISSCKSNKNTIVNKVNKWLVFLHILRMFHSYFKKFCTLHCKDTHPYQKALQYPSCLSINIVYNGYNRNVYLKRIPPLCFPKHWATLRGKMKRGGNASSVITVCDFWR